MTAARSARVACDAPFAFVALTAGLKTIDNAEFAESDHAQKSWSLGCCLITCRPWSRRFLKIPQHHKGDSLRGNFRVLLRDCLLFGELLLLFGELLFGLLLHG